MASILDKHVTDGDTSCCPCPWCGKNIRDLWDYGNFHIGIKIDCPDCEKPVECVEIIHTIYLARTTEQKE